jgi:hypothetical protein
MHLLPECDTSSGVTYSGRCTSDGSRDSTPHGGLVILLLWHLLEILSIGVQTRSFGLRTDVSSVTLLLRFLLRLDVAAPRWVEEILELTPDSRISVKESHYSPP